LAIVRSDVIGPLLELSKDPIPNIRFNVAKALEVMATSFTTVPEGPAFVQEFIIPALDRQKNDSDADVRYFATRALQKAGTPEP
jgi:serine/threonine-protein phosphatase 2A regulatory subunit A